MRYIILEKTTRCAPPAADTSSSTRWDAVSQQLEVHCWWRLIDVQHTHVGGRSGVTGDFKHELIPTPQKLFRGI